MHTKTEEFTSEGQTVRGDLIVPAPGSPCILMSHGFEASKDGTKWSFLTPRLVDRGYAVLKFNYRGCGYGPDASDGLFENTTLSARIADYRAALDFLQDADVDPSRIAVIGSSFGGEIPVAAPRLARQGLRPPCNTLPTPNTHQRTARRMPGHRLFLSPLRKEAHTGLFRGR